MNIFTLEIQFFKFCSAIHEVKKQFVAYLVRNKVGKKKNTSKRLITCTVHITKQENIGVRESCTSSGMS